MKRVAIVGSRGFTDDVLVTAAVTHLAASNPWLTILSGGAGGVDTMVREACVGLGFHACEGNAMEEPQGGHHFVEYLAIWRVGGTLDRGAGFRRNRRIVAEADLVIALFAPGPRSKGTSNMVELAQRGGLPLHVYHEGEWLDA